MSDFDAQSIAQWILALSAPEKGQDSLPARGKFLASEQADLSANPALKLVASYTDQPVEGIEAFNATADTTLRSNRLGADQITSVQGLKRVKGLPLFEYTDTESILRIPNADLKGIRELTLEHDSDLSATLTVSIRYGTADGEELAHKALEPGQTSTLRLRRPRNPKPADLYITLRSESAKPTARLKALTLEP